MVQLTLNLLLLVITVILSGLSVGLGYDTRIFQKRTSIREAIEQLDPFVETDPFFKIQHSLIEFEYLSREPSVTILFRYISLFYPENAMGGQPRRFQEIVDSNEAFPDRYDLIEGIEVIDDINSATFTERGLEVQIESLDPIAIVEAVHRIQREFRDQIDSEEEIEKHSYGY